ncbi:type II secretion system inner membrane protein GspF [Kordiimonas gwangyangensis]|uniref:type II secretion system inner membrane protein GspF n=1 Tax=Kordiimonas gwangyangensis TaxID=288022 RepID=UPI00037B8828|nr:type II secretion system inner membrane protein GspF [Kordiimonas gwangyangensis]
MLAFEYEALDGKGRARSGVITAESERDARERLKANALFATSLSPASQKRGGRKVSLFKRDDVISTKDLALITRQLATMLGAAATVEEALGAIAAQAEKPGPRRVLTRVRSSVMEGLRLSQAMEQEPKSFDPLYRAMVAAGEASGDLARVLSNVAEHREKSQETKNKVQSALIYPIVLAVVAVAVVTALMIFVVPKVVSQFENFGSDLPVLTQIVVGVSDFLVGFGLWLFLGLAAAIFAFISAMRQPAFRMQVHTALLRVPVIGRLIRAVNAARFARALGTLVSGGSPVLEGLMAARETVRNDRMRAALDRAIDQIREGMGTSAALRQAGEFPPMLGYMVAAGEKSGQLAHMLYRVADYLDAEFDGFTKTALSLLEPLIVIMMGGIVGAIVLSIMLPILKLNSLVLG